jgi:BirA family biotin operon repressor/biotin-[acetyl-CoA-carboxylase] ligase
MEVLRYSVIPSTQDLARQLALGSHRLPFAVLAQTQSRGRGRLGRDWLSPEGGLWLTVALDVPSAEAIRQAALVAAFAVAHALLAISGLQMYVKWPNDLLVRRRKVCGILAETLVQPAKTTLLLGMGINVNNSVDENCSLQATSLNNELKHTVSLDDLTAAVIAEVECDIAILIQRGFTPFQPWIQSHLALLGETITVEFNGQRESGRVEGLSSTGALLLADKDSLVKEVDAGSVYYW